MIKEIKRIRLETKFINYIKSTHEVSQGGKTALYSHGTRFVFFSSHETKVLKVYYNNLLETFNDELPYNYIELIDKAFNPRHYEIIISS